MGVRYMEEAYWKQFITTGKIEDYLQYKGISDREEKVQGQEEIKGEKPDAGFGKFDSHCS